MGFTSCGYLDNGPGMLRVPWRVVLVVLDHLSPILFFFSLADPIVDRTLIKTPLYHPHHQKSRCCQCSMCQVHKVAWRGFWRIVIVCHRHVKKSFALMTHSLACGDIRHQKVKPSDLPQSRFVNKCNMTMFKAGLGPPFHWPESNMIWGGVDTMSTLLCIKIDSFRFLFFAFFTLFFFPQALSPSLLPCLVKIASETWKTSMMIDPSHPLLSLLHLSSQIQGR
jgi:hypothetical protein